MTGRAVSISPGALDRAAQQRVHDLDHDRFHARFWSGDASLWGEDPGFRERVASRLGWLRLPEDSTPIPPPAAGPILLLGMGGSSLGAEALARAFGNVDLHVLDSTVPGTVDAALRSIGSLSSVTAIVASKSGTTIETITLAEVIETLEQQPAWGAITDPATPLERRAKERGHAQLWHGREDVGGRFSVLSAFGLVPAALAGVDVAGVVAAAGAFRDECAAAGHVAADPGLGLGVLLGVAAEEGRSRLEIHTSARLVGLAEWIEQLVAESTGKDGHGILPLVCPPAALSSRHDDRLLVTIEIAGDRLPETVEDRIRSIPSDVPKVRIRLPAPASIGAEFVRWQVATAVAGALLGVNPFDEPDVAASKRRARDVLRSGAQTDEVPTAASEAAALFLGAEAPEPGLSNEDLAARLLRAIRPAAGRDHIGMLAYLPRPACDAALRSLQEGLSALADTVTLGWGPRYLHSTGQLHKGGPNTGSYLVVTGESDSGGAPGPGADRLAALVRAQALGDLGALGARGRQVTRLHLRGDPAESLGIVVDACAATLSAGSAMPDADGDSPIS